MRGLLVSKTPLDTLEHRMSDYLARETASGGDPQHDLARSQVSSAKATRTLWPFQHAISKPSEVHLDVRADSW
jgi:hypothetical protein